MVESACGFGESYCHRAFQQPENDYKSERETLLVLFLTGLCNRWILQENDVFSNCIIADAS